MARVQHDSHSAAPALPRGPYPGLRPFDVGEGTWFCGRDDQIREIHQRLADQRFIAILGGSGSGKSSLIRAGVIPQLRLPAIPKAGDCWLAATFTPGTQPIERLVEALESLLVDVEGPDKEIRRASLADTLRQWNGMSAVLQNFRDQLAVEDGSDALRARANVVLVVDQFEELFRPENRQNREAARLIELISAHHKRPDDRLYVILTMRSESLHHCAEYLDLVDALNRSSYLVRRLDEDQIAEAIIKPARRFAGRLADPDADKLPVSTFQPEVVKRLLEAVREIRDDSDHLPLLQHLLFHTWESALRREGKQPGEDVPKELTVEDLEDAAGIRGSAPSETSNILRQAVEYQAERVLAGLDGNQDRGPRAAAEVMFRLMGVIDANGVFGRRWTSEDEIRRVSGQDAASIREAVQSFREPHPFVRQDHGDLDVSHEALIRNWPRLAGWVRTETRRGRVFREAHEECVAWLEGQKAGLLARALPLGSRLLDVRQLQRVKALELDSLGADWIAHYSDEALEPGQEREVSFEHWKSFLKWSRRRRRILRGAPLLILGSLVIGGMALTMVRRQNLEIDANDATLVGTTRAREITAFAPTAVRAHRLLQALQSFVTAEGLKGMRIPVADDRYRARRVLASALTYDGLRDVLGAGLWPSKESEGEGVPKSRRLTGSCEPITSSDGRTLLIRPDGVFSSPDAAKQGCAADPLLPLVAGLPAEADVRIDPELNFVVARIPDQSQKGSRWQAWRISWTAGAAGQRFELGEIDREIMGTDALERWSVSSRDSETMVFNFKPAGSKSRRVEFWTLTEVFAPLPAPGADWRELRNGGEECANVGRPESLKQVRHRHRTKDGWCLVVRELAGESGSLVTQRVELYGIALDGIGDETKEQLLKFPTFSWDFRGPRIQAVAVDPTSVHVRVSDGRQFAAHRSESLKQKACELLKATPMLRVAAPAEKGGGANTDHERIVTLIYGRQEWSEATIAELCPTPPSTEVAG